MVEIDSVEGTPRPWRMTRAEHVTMTTLHSIETTPEEHRVVWESYPSWAHFSWLYLLGALSSLRGGLFFKFGVEGWETWMVGTGLLVVCAAVLRRWAHYELMTGRIVVRNGYTGQEILSMPLSEASEVTIRQGVVAGFFGIGTLVIRSRTTDRLLSLRGVADPEEVKIRIQGAVWRYHRATSHSQPARQEEPGEASAT